MSVALYMDVHIFQQVPIGRCIEDLELIAKAGDTEEFTNRVLYLPL